MTDILYKDESYKIIGAAMEVHTTLGYGFVEPVYQEALEIELCEREIPFLPQSPIDIYYKRKKLKKSFIADFFCYDDIIVEIKAVAKLLPEHEAQIINYLKATNVQLGLLINFGEKSLSYKRYLNID
ncbi:MAG: GxxExxY protein [Paludibacter sp.]|nr:GxxExxY protein [Paludibacter sp.]